MSQALLIFLVEARLCKGNSKLDNSKLCDSKEPWVEEIHPEMFKALDIVGLSWVAHL